MRKIVSFILSIILIIGLVGCGNEKETKEGKVALSKEASVAKDSLSAEPEKTELTEEDIEAIIAGRTGNWFYEDLSEEDKKKYDKTSSGFNEWVLKGLKENPREFIGDFKNLAGKYAKYFYARYDFRGAEDGFEWNDEITAETLNRRGVYLVRYEKNKKVETKEMLERMAKVGNYLVDYSLGQYGFYFGTDLKEVPFVAISPYLLSYGKLYKPKEERAETPADEISNGKNLNDDQMLFKYGVIGKMKYHWAPKVTAKELEEKGYNLSEAYGDKSLTTAQVMERLSKIKIFIVANFNYKGKDFKIRTNDAGDYLIIPEKLANLLLEHD